MADLGLKWILSGSKQTSHYNKLSLSRDIQQMLIKTHQDVIRSRLTEKSVQKKKVHSTYVYIDYADYLI